MIGSVPHSLPFGDHEPSYRAMRSSNSNHRSTSHIFRLSVLPKILGRRKASRSRRLASHSRGAGHVVGGRGQAMTTFPEPRGPASRHCHLMCRSSQEVQRRGVSGRLRRVAERVSSQSGPCVYQACHGHSMERNCIDAYVPSLPCCALR